VVAGAAVVLRATATVVAVRVAAGTVMVRLEASKVAVRAAVMTVLERVVAAGEATAVVLKGVVMVEVVRAAAREAAAWAARVVRAASSSQICHHWLQTC
jgi:hypothetical protein